MFIKSDHSAAIFWITKIFQRQIARLDLYSLSGLIYLLAIFLYLLFIQFALLTSWNKWSGLKKKNYFFQSVLVCVLFEIEGWNPFFFFFYFKLVDDQLKWITQKIQDSEFAAFKF